MGSPSKVVYVHQYFKTPSEGGGIRSYHLAKSLVQKGIEVVMITSHNAPSYLQKKVEGIHVHYLPIPYSNHLSFTKRILAFVRFMFKSIYLLHKVKQVDVCYVMTTPLSTGVIALYAKFVKRIPYIFEIGDLWPSVPVQMGVIRNKLLTSFLFFFEKLVYRQARAIVALSPAIADYIQALVPQKEIRCIPNIASTAFFDTHIADDGCFRIGYFGTAGMANKLVFLLAAAKQAKEKSLNVHFDIMAEGAELTFIKEEKEKMNLTNLSFFSYGGKEKVKERLLLCQAIYISFADIPLLATGSPNKLFDGLSAGKLIIINFEGWIKKLIEENECGFSYNPHHPDEFVQELIIFLRDRDKLMTYQENARALAMHYSEENAANKLYELMVNFQKMK